MFALRNVLVALIVPLAVTACANHDSKPAATPATQPVVEIPTIDVAQPASAPMLASNAPDSATPAVEQPASSRADSDITDIIKSRQKPAAALPSGHPDVSNSQGVATPPAMPALPSGHPDISKMQAPTTQKASLIGSLSIQAVQSTPNGPAIGAVPATVELYQNDKLFDKMEAKLDANGRLAINDVPVGLVIQPVVRVHYNGAEYEATGEVMDGQHAKQEIKVPVFEATDKEPAWQIRMQHLIVEPTVEGVQVMEMLAIENPSDHAWLGKTGADGKRTTIAFPLPVGAKDVQLSGAFHEGSARVEADKVIDSLALIPGTTQYRIVYTVPVTAGAAAFAITTPAAVQQMMLFVADDGTTVKAEGLQASGVVDMGKGKTRMFQGSNLKSGETIKLAIANITASAAQVASGEAEHSHEAPATSNPLPKVIAAVGGLLIFVVGGFFLFVKSPKPVTKKSKA